MPNIYLDHEGRERILCKLRDDNVHIVARYMMENLATEDGEQRPVEHWEAWLESQLEYLDSGRGEDIRVIDPLGDGRQAIVFRKAVERYGLVYVGKMD